MTPDSHASRIAEQLRMVEEDEDLDDDLSESARERRKEIEEEHDLGGESP